ncbi:MAG: DUF5642 family protein [Acidimicrobiales bacterium]
MTGATRRWPAALVALLLAGCAHAGEPTSVPSDNAQARHINPANIKRVGRELPLGYEVTGVPGPAEPPALWGLGTGWTADPPRCAALADPGGGHGVSAQGISGSGAGGIVHAVVAAAPTGLVAADAALVAGCPQWSMTNQRARARVHLIEAPRIDGVQTLGMVTDTMTSVEGGNEIASRANTFTAYLGGYYAFTTLITDPGAPHPPLAPQFAADLLVKSVAALRS